jgi:hypothetical protein
MEQGPLNGLLTSNSCLADFEILKKLGEGSFS